MSLAHLTSAEAACYALSMQAFYCSTCRVAYTAALRGKSCPSCGDELIHGRVPAGKAGRLMRPKQPHASRAVWDYIIKKDPCVYCGEQSTTIDHIQPKALGGSKGSWTNRAGACFSCNQKKAHTPLLHFMLELQGESLDHVKDEDGRWIIPHDELAGRRALVDAEEKAAREAHADPRRLFESLKYAA